ncbi:DUF6049 family protein [Saccharomonospora sp. CUA-673]|uniref:DUF6049 family protein n=1 Tax=Saccharomonospora sp. CUA-673 TaxID=1904969 RepID=UPI0009F941CC|nr:DUF6049 family protein [Saccharomonospora sp. CUA-673]
MSRFSAFALALAFLLTQGLFAHAPAGAQPHPAQQPGQYEPQPEQQLSEPDLLTLDVEEFEPRLLTAGGPEGRIRVSGTVTNTGDREISEVVARLQIGQPVQSSAQFHSVTSEPPPTDAGMSEWITLADSLRPGQSTRVEFDVPAAQLPLGTPGVYPLLVNVNGTPAYGGPARLASMNMMLPVIDPPSGVPPARTSLLWPLTAERPAVVSDPHDDTIVLADDGLANAVAPGGRLDALVESALAKQEDAALFRSMCFAIDPELLGTVEQMAGGYRVRTDRGDVPGGGAEHAQRWLDRLRTLVSAHCVVRMPYADATWARSPGSTATRAWSGWR